MPVLRSRDVGDLYIQVVVETPQKLTKRQRELLTEFDAGMLKGNSSGELRLFFAVREFFDGLADPPSLTVVGLRSKSRRRSARPRGSTRASVVSTAHRHASCRSARTASRTRPGSCAPGWSARSLTGAVTPSGKHAGAHHGVLCRPAGARPGDRARPRHRPGDGRADPARRRAGPAGPRRVQPGLLQASEAALPQGDDRPGRRLRPPRDARRHRCTEPAAATVSSLPLFTKPLEMRLDLLAGGAGP